MAFGDLYLEDVRRYREERLAGTGITPVFPLWGRETRALVHDMLEGVLRARITCIDPGQLPRSSPDVSWIGRCCRAAARTDPCAENGEFAHPVPCRADLRSPACLLRRCRATRRLRFCVFTWSER